jgi:hypothetical protein
MNSQYRTQTSTFQTHGILDGAIDAVASEVKTLANDLIPDNLVGDLFDVLDKPQLGVHPEPLVYKEQSYMSNTRNLDYVEVLTADPKALVQSDDDIFGTTVNEMSIPDLLTEKFCLVATIPWKSTDSIGKVLFSESVGPMSQFPISLNNTKPDPVTLHDAIASRFSFWAGSVRYVVRIVGTQFHEGKLNLNFHPALSPDTTDALSATDSVTQYTLSHFVRNGKNIIPVSCPYLGDTPYKRVWSGQVLNDNYAAGGARFVDYFSGSFEVRVATQLNSPAAVANNISIQIFRAFGPDFQLAMNTPNGVSFQWWNKDDLRTVDDFVVHSGTATDAPGLGQPVAVSSNMSGVVLSEQETPSVITRVENRTSIKSKRSEAYNNDKAFTLEDMIKRYNLVSTVNWSATDAPFTPLATGVFDVITDLLKLQIASAPFERFERFRCDKIKLRFQTVSNRFAFGDLIAVFIPTMLPLGALQAPVAPFIPSPQCLTTLPHVSLDPNSGTVATLEIPFVYNKQWIDLLNGDVLGQLMLIPLVAFTPGTDGPSDAQIQIFMSIEGAEFKQPRIGSNVPPLAPVAPLRASVQKFHSAPFDVHSGSADDVPDRNTPMSKYKFEQLCATGGMWSDVKNTQFGESFVSLRDLCKKTQPYYRTTTRFTFADFTEDVLEGTTPIVGSFPAANFNKNCGSPFMANHINFCSQMYRLFRGSLGYKVRVRAYAIPKAGEGITPAVGPLPPFTVRAYVTPIVSGEAAVPEQDTAYALPSVFDPNISCVPPLSMAYASDRQTAEFKMPWLSNRTSCLIPQNYDIGVPNNYEFDNFYTPGLLVGFYMEGLPPMAALESYDLRVNTEIDVYFGDETTFGVYTGYPLAYIKPRTGGHYATQPDQWWDGYVPPLLANKTQHNKPTTPTRKQ